MVTVVPIRRSHPLSPPRGMASYRFFFLSETGRVLYLGGRGQDEW